MDCYNGHEIQSLTTRSVKRISVPESSSYLDSPRNSSSLEINTKTFSDDQCAGFNDEQRNSHDTTTSSASYTFLQIKKEPCQVSEITTSNAIDRHHPNNLTAMSMVKIESSTPKSNLNDKGNLQTNVPVGIAVGRKRPQEQATALPLLSRDCFGISVGEFNGVTQPASCSNLYFDENELSSSHSVTENIIGAQNIQNVGVGRATSSFWQYPNSVPLDSVFSMPVPPAGFQYSREPNRGQVLFLPATPGIESLPPTYVWPSYLHPSNSLQAAPNFVFPSITSPHQPPYVPFQFVGSNYLTTASTTLHQHTQSHGTRFIALSSDGKKNSAIKHHSTMKIEDWNTQQSTLSKSVLMSHQCMSSIEKDNQKNVFNYQVDETRPQTMPLSLSPPHNQLATDISPMQAIPLIKQSLLPSIPTETYLTPVIPETEIIDNSNSTLYKAPEMQDVNIQTDTPICSEDENTIVSGDIPILASHQQADTASGNSIESTNEIVYMSPHFPISDSASKENCPDFYQNENVHRIVKCPEIPVDITGLELLSNISTEALGTKFLIKQESIEDTSVKRIDNANPTEDINTPIVNADCFNTNADQCEQLGGLNLLCALAEQRIHEEVEANSKEREELPLDADYRITKKKKRKHSKSKSRKKNLYHKSKKYRRYFDEYVTNLTGDIEDSSDDANSDIKNAFKKIKSRLIKRRKCIHGERHCCREICTWPNPEEFLKAMESDMRMRLADITRQYKKKKKKLNAYNKNHKRKKQLSLECSISENIDKTKPQSNVFSDSCETTQIDKEEFNDIEHSRAPYNSMTANNKSYQFCSSQNDDENEQKTIETINAKQQDKQFNYDIMNLESVNSERENSISSKKQHRKEAKSSVYKQTSNSDLNTNVINSKDDDRRKILDAKLILTSDHLYENKTRILTDMGGLFYAGYLSPLQPPDVYAVSLDGERGNKSHIMSREEVMKDTILEMSPTSLEDIPTGTRLCAYWSQQYRCLYPGRATESETHDRQSDKIFVSVEFDDGDSGKIRLDNIRFLLSDYPIVEYESNPLGSIGKPKGRLNKSDNVPSHPLQIEGNENISEETTEFIHQNKKKLKSLHKIRTDTTDTNVLHKHRSEENPRKLRKHKKRKKHKKRHHRNFYALMNSTDQTTVETKNVCEKTFAELTTFQNVMESTVDSIETFDITENNLSGSPKKNSQLEDKKDDRIATKDNHSKIAAFLPDRQLWSWLGSAYRKAGQKGKARKHFYKSIQRGKEIITIGDSAVFLSTGRPDRPYIGRIESMWETSASNKVVRVKWFYHPEETFQCPTLKFPGALFESPHEDENDVQTISHKCEVLQFASYEAKFGPDPDKYEFIYDNNDTYYLSGYYNPKSQSLKLYSDIPVSKTFNI